MERVFLRPLLSKLVIYAFASYTGTFVPVLICFFHDKTFLIRKGNISSFFQFVSLHCQYIWTCFGTIPDSYLDKSRDAYTEKCSAGMSFQTFPVLFGIIRCTLYGWRFLAKAHLAKKRFSFNHVLRVDGGISKTSDVKFTSLFAKPGWSKKYMMPVRCF